MAFGSLPLAAYRLVESGDAELVRSTVGNVFCDFCLSPLRKRRLEGTAALNAHFHGLQLGSGGIYYLDYGTDVHIEPKGVDNCYLVSILLAGRARVFAGSQTFVASPERGYLLQPNLGVSMTVEETAQHLILRLEQTMVQDTLRKKLDREPTVPIVFDPQLDLTASANQTFRGLLGLFVDGIDAAAPASLAMQEFERLLVSQLILGQPSNYRDEVNHSPRPATARSIARAAELIEAHADEPLTVDDIACAIGVTPRCLQNGFRKAYDTTPMAFLRDVRLQRVRTDLMRADSTRTTVTAVALRWGFLHLGRFSVMYHRRFGETPSQTLRLMTDQSSQPI